MAGTRQTSQNRKPPPVPDPVPSPRITIEDTNNKREIPTTNLVSPDTQKKKYIAPPKVSAGTGTAPREIYYDDIITESCGRHGEFVVVTVQHVSSGQGGFMSPLTVALKDKDSRGGGVLRNSNTFDCRIPTYLFIRESHDNDNQVELKYVSRKLYQLGIVAFPNRKKLSTFDSEGIETGALDVEKKMRDQCEKILLKGGSTTSTKVTKYTAWQPSNQSHTKDPYRYLDEIFTDESVDAIMMAYYFDRDFDRREVYETLIAKDINGFYSRSNSTRKYSNYAIKAFGFPEGVPVAVPEEDEND